MAHKVLLWMIRTALDRPRSSMQLPTVRLTSASAIILQRSKFCWRQQGRAGRIVGPGYILRGHILGCSQRLASRLHWSKECHQRGAPTVRLWPKKCYQHQAPTDLLWPKKRGFPTHLQDTAWEKCSFFVISFRHQRGVPTDLLDV